MDTVFYTVVKSLILPPGGLILLFLLGFFLVRGVLGRVFIFIALTVFSLMTLPAVAGKLMAGLESYPALKLGRLLGTDADGILILSAGRYTWAPEYGGDTVGSNTLERLRYGAFLHRQTGLPIYVTGGSPPPEDPPMGRLMAQVLAGEYGVEVAGVEDRSLTTAENAVFSAQMLERDGIGHVLLVTHAWHLPRAVDAFERAGVETTPAPTYFVHREGEGKPDYRRWLPDAGAFTTSYYALHEYLGRAWYQFKATVGGGGR
ncbi:MAG: YdcF family protein [Pseudomonadota bacterium]|nr:YdcF family protein [Pseudomonadota bacterium]